MAKPNTEQKAEGPITRFEKFSDAGVFNNLMICHRHKPINCRDT